MEGWGLSLDSDRWGGILGRAEPWVIEHLDDLAPVLVWWIHQPEASWLRRPLNPQFMNTEDEING